MKRAICLFVALILAVIMYTASSESIDLQGISDDALIDLLNSVQTELINRGIVRSGELAEGIYYVGKDIVAGSYNIICANMDEKESSYYTLVPSMDLYNMYLELDKEMYVALESNRLGNDKPVKIDLNDGAVFIVKSNPIRLEALANNLVP